MDSSGDSRLTATGMAIGTPAYMSPEQAAGERDIDGRSDLYSLGILGYQMLTGEPPFAAGSTPAMLVKHISERPVPVEQRRPDVPTDLARSVMMLLEKDPAHRFPTASALVAALDTREAPPSRGPVPAAGASAAMSAPSRPSYAPPAEGPYAPAPYLAGGRPLVNVAGATTSDELRRWEAPPVVAFRRRIAPYLFVNGVIVLFSLFGSSQFFFVTVLWSIIIAFKYARLWSDGYDWRDVFRQPRDREIMEVIEEAVDYVRAIFNPRVRSRLSEERAQRKLAARMAPARLPSGFAASPVPMSYGAAHLNGPQGDRARQAMADRDEILRRLNDLPKDQKEQLGDVSRSAIALADKVQSLALLYEESARQDIGSAREQLEGEISALENAANPLDRGSEDRVRRLAYLKRQRRALVDAAQRKDTLGNKLETCALALQNMRFDMMRLGASPQMHQHITSLANQALNLADNVDDALFVADEMGRVGSKRSSGSRRATERG
jgi:serine/threonine-protein kinase